MASMFNQTMYSDIIVLIQDVALPAHQFVIGLQSAFLKKAIHKGFAKGKEMLKFQQGSGTAH
jgi:hypothetical protein